MTTVVETAPTTRTTRTIGFSSEPSRIAVPIGSENPVRVERRKERKECMAVGRYMILPNEVSLIATLLIWMVWMRRTICWTEILLLTAALIRVRSTWGSPVQRLG